MFAGADLDREELEKRAASVEVPSGEGLAHKQIGAELDREEVEKKAASVEVPSGEGLAHELPSAAPQVQRRAAKGWLAKPWAVIRSPFIYVAEITRRIGRFARVFVALTDMSRSVHVLQQRSDELQQRSDELRQRSEELNWTSGRSIDEIRAALQELRQELLESQRQTDRVLLGMRETATDQAARLASLSNSFNAQISALAAMQTALPAKVTASDAESPLMARLYSVIEDNFRGSRNDIMRRQGVYLPDIRAAITRSRSNIVLDLGCGRGEWLESLRLHGITAVGVDTHPGQLAEARSLGLAVTEGDAYAFMTAEPANRFAAVTAFHVAEHLPFDVLARWLVEAFRVLAPGGVMILETPNPANVIVGSSSFYLDPTHNKPLPTELLRVLARSVGFGDLESRFLHPHEHLKAALEELPPDIAYLLFGYQDYAVIAIKPTS